MKNTHKALLITLAFSTMIGYYQQLTGKTGGTISEPVQAMRSPVINTRSVLVTGEDGANVGTLIQDDPAAIRIRYHKKWDCEPGSPISHGSQEWTWLIKGGAADGQVKGIDCSGLITDPAYTYYRGEPAVVDRVAGTANVTIGDRVFSWVE